MISIRPERTQDAGAVRCVNEQTFETAAEADLVDLLRARGKLVVSLVACTDDQVVGHTAFSQVTIASSPHLQGFGAAPVTVMPDMQRRRTTMQRCKRGHLKGDTVEQKK